MKRTNKLILTFMVLMSCISFAGSAQIFVTVRPPRPHYVRVVAPSPRHVWVEEEWVERGGRYEWAGGHWVEPPRPHARWIPGHWANRPRGWVWIPGHWRY